MNSLNNFMIFIVILLISTTSFAESDISWNNPDSYSDIESPSQSQKKYQESIFNVLEKHLNKLSQKLPKGHKLWMKVNDLDLAGAVYPGYAYGVNDTRDFRVVKRMDYPKMNFTFHLTDSSGKVLKSGSVFLKDKGFQDKLHTRKITSDSLGYEKRMLEEWYKSEFASKMAMK